MTEYAVCDCRYLQTTCINCGRIVCHKTLPEALEWIKIKDKAPPFMRDVVFYADGDTCLGWNETTEPGEDPSYYTREGLENITHWMPIPEPPEKE